jgi:hypothetical protein
MYWRHGSISRAHALQVQNPEFTSQSHQEKKNLYLLIHPELSNNQRKSGKSYLPYFNLIPQSLATWFLYIVVLSLPLHPRQQNKACQMT